MILEVLMDDQISQIVFRGYTIPWYGNIIVKTHNIIIVVDDDDNGKLVTTTHKN